MAGPRTCGSGKRAVMCVGQVACGFGRERSIILYSRFKHELPRLNERVPQSQQPGGHHPFGGYHPWWLGGREACMVGANGREAGRSLVMCARVAHLSLVIFLER